MIATLAFFVLQGVSAFFIMASAKAAPGLVVVFVAFAIAGFIVFAVLQAIYFFYKTLDKPRVFGTGWLKSAVMGVLLGCGTGCIALLYTRVVNFMGWFAAHDASAAKINFKNYPLAVFLGIVVAAPIFEEYIFRGVIFASLKRTWSWPAALVASAALFAVIHPPVSAFPVFFLGLATAYVYHRSGMLLGCMLTHATYNGIIYFTMMS
jgi:membrane protease YdiL (CAAX protease family)